MPVTGKDQISLDILNSFKKGSKLKDIPSMYPVSLDQAKRLSRYYNLLEKANIHLHTSEIEKIKTIGLKILYLSPLFKQGDWEGLTEILSSVNENIKRDEFPLLTQALEEKRKRVSDFKQEIESNIARLEHRERKLRDLENSIIETQKKIEEQTAFLNRYPENVRTFLVEHLGIYKNKLVLSKRLDSRWQKNLKKKDILTYNEFEYVWYVNDLEALVEDYSNRVNRKRPLATEWEYDKEFKRYGFGASNTPYYKMPQGLAVDLRSSIQEVEEKMQATKEERKTIQQEMKELKKTSPKSFIEAVEATNTLSALELKLHGELQDKAMKWLYNRGFVVASEITLLNGKRADVIGYNEKGHIVIVEVKVSAADFLQDKKWKSYLEYSDEFYFLLKAGIIHHYHTRKEYTGIGLLNETRNNLKIGVEHTLKHEAKEREKIKFTISKALSKKHIYGY